MGEDNKKRIFSWEKKLLEWMQKNFLLLVVFFITFISIFVRIKMLPLVSVDMEYCLLPWYQEALKYDGFKSLSVQTGDYNILYQTIIVILTYLPIDAINAYKFLSIIFDYLLAMTAGVMVFQLGGKSREKAFWAYIAVICCPMTVLNSSAWGQCDSMYVFFCILALFMLSREKYTGAFAFLGLGFALKLQTVFILPFFLYYYYRKRKFSILYFGITPVVMMLSGIVGVIEGRGIFEVFSIYFNQTSTYSYTIMNYPSIWNLAVKNFDANYSVIFLALCLVSTLVVLVVLMAKAEAHEIDGLMLMRLAFIMSYASVLFLPRMHDRYDYLYVILAIILSFLDKRFIPAAAVLMLINLRVYGVYLFRNSMSDIGWPLISVVNVICFLYCCRLIYGKRNMAERKE